MLIKAGPGSQQGRLGGLHRLHGRLGAVGQAERILDLPSRHQFLGLRDQVLCTRYTAGGDSGSVVLNSRNRIVGLHFAGSESTSIFNRISHVFTLLDIDLP